MTDATRLSAALADRYRLERELGQGGESDVVPLVVVENWFTAVSATCLAVTL